MWPVSAAFTAACRAPAQQIRSRAELWRDGVKAVDVTITAGQVSIDRARDVRRILTATLLDLDATLTPNDAHDLLTPAGTQLRCWRGLMLPDGTLEEVPVGLFRLVDPQVALTSNGVQITVSGQDESMTVQANRFTSAYRIAAGTPVGEGLARLLRDRHRYLTIRDDTPAGVTFDAAVTLASGADSAPWTQAQSLAGQHGFDINIDPSGVAVIRPLPTGKNTPAAVYERGAEAVITAITRGFTAERTYSGVVVTGEPPDRLPVTSILWDTDTNSPTFADGRFGRKPYFITSQLIATQAQADATAQAWLPLVSGIMEQVTWDQVVNPALDVFDVVAVTDPDVKLAAAQLMIDSLTIPLDHASTMTAVTRSRPLTEARLP